MESVKAEAVAGEGKAVTSERFRYEEESCGAPQREEAEIEKTVFVERGGRAHGASERNVQSGCMPAVNKAGNRVTWNLFFCGAGWPAPLALY